VAEKGVSHNTELLVENRINHIASEQSHTTNKQNKQKLVNTREGDVIGAIWVARAVAYNMICKLVAAWKGEVTTNLSEKWATSHNKAANSTNKRAFCSKCASASWEFVVIVILPKELMHQMLAHAASSCVTRNLFICPLPQQHFLHWSCINLSSLGCAPVPPSEVLYVPSALS
jgi:hypothetical protein